MMPGHQSNRQNSCCICLLDYQLMDVILCDFLVEVSFGYQGEIREFYYNKKIQVIQIRKQFIKKIINSQLMSQKSTYFPKEKYDVSSSIILSIIIFRSAIFLLPLNYDYPDQYWQGPEIAYKIYNKLINNNDQGYQTWQWTMEDPIRNPIYQFLLALGYIGAHGIIQVMKTVQQRYGMLEQIGQSYFDTILQLGPKIVQACLAMVGDVYIVKLLYFYFDKDKVPSFWLFLILSNWFYMTMLSRTYINSFECILMAASLYYWQLHHYRNLIARQNSMEIEVITRNDLISRVIVLVGYVARPTSLIPWIVIWPYELLSLAFRDMERKQQKLKQNQDSSQQKQSLLRNIFKKKIKFILIAKILFKNIIQIFMMLSCSFIVGSLYFKKPILTEWNFVYYNLILKWSEYFEVHPWHFYFTFSIPVIQGGYLVFLAVGLWNGIVGDNMVKLGERQKVKQKMFSTLCWMTFLLIIILTLVSGHKEHRFLMILMPFFSVINLSGLKSLKSSLQNKNQNSSFRYNLYKAILVSIVFLNIFLLCSITLYPKGGVSLLRTIRKDINAYMETNNQNRIQVGIMYLCQSHALPAYSIILRDIIIRIPDSSPLAKINNASQIIQLQQNPHKVYNKFLNYFNDASMTSKTEVKYVILQQKFSKHQLPKGEKSIQFTDREARDLLVVSEKWKFIQEEYDLIEVENYRNFWEEIVFGHDYLYLYKKKQ